MKGDGSDREVHVTPALLMGVATGHDLSTVLSSSALSGDSDLSSIVGTRASELPLWQWLLPELGFKRVITCEPGDLVVYTLLPSTMPGGSPGMVVEDELGTPRADEVINVDSSRSGIIRLHACFILG